MHPKKVILSPAQLIALGFIISIIAGSLLLALPVASATGASIGYVDALFTATASVCVTGLLTLDIGSAFSPVGHVFILLLIQIGALGFMTFATVIFGFIRGRIGLKERILLRESLNEDSMHGLTQMVGNILKLSFLIEGIGALLLLPHFLPDYGSRGIFISIFHSVSSFCNAGIDLFGDDRSLADYSGNIPLQLISMALAILGSLGFTVIPDIIQRFKGGHKLSLHTKIVLKGSAALLAAGALFFTLAEWNHAYADMPATGKVMAGVFQSATLRSVGYTTIDQNLLYPHSRMLSMLLMFIGGAPASTTGGIKITTLMVVIMSVNSIIRNKTDVEIGKRRIGLALVRRSTAIIFIAIAFIMGIALLLSISESGGITMEQALYEAFSSCGTVGMTLGITEGLNVFSKLLLIVAMFFGRVGPFTLALALSGKSKTGSIRYPEDRIIIG